MAVTDGGEEPVLIWRWGSLLYRQLRGRRPAGAVFTFVAQYESGYADPTPRHHHHL